MCMGVVSSLLLRAVVICVLSADNIVEVVNDVQLREWLGIFQVVWIDGFVKVLSQQVQDCQTDTVRLSYLFRLVCVLVDVLSFSHQKTIAVNQMLSANVT